MDIELLAEAELPTPVVNREDRTRPSEPGAGPDRTSAATAPAAGVVVCGGKSRRMGRDKARLEIGGGTLLERVIAELSSVVGEVVLACGPEARYGELGLPLALDELADGGPLAGIVAGLEAVRAPRALVVACDMPRLDAALFTALLRRAREEELDVCYFEGPRGIEPLCAVYSRRCLGPMREALLAGRRQVRSFLEEERGLAVGRLGEAELDEELSRSDPATNLNTPEDLARERERWARGDSR